VNDIEKIKNLLRRALVPVEEMASLTECPDDAQLAKEIRECLGEE